MRRLLTRNLKKETVMIADAYEIDPKDADSNEEAEYCPDDLTEVIDYYGLGTEEDYRSMLAEAKRRGEF